MNSCINASMNRNDRRALKKPTTTRVWCLGRSLPIRLELRKELMNSTSFPQRMAKKRGATLRFHLTRAQHQFENTTAFVAVEFAFSYLEEGLEEDCI